MKREIKFRGKRLDNGKWVYGYLAPAVTSKEVKSAIFTIWRTKELIFGCTTNEVIPETVGQYTGLKDKNGKEIYEGDIISFLDGYSTESGFVECYCVGEVSWEEEIVSFCVSERCSVESYEALDDCVIIGNIYDNPELMEVE